MRIEAIITQVRGREILDSRGNPTVEAEVIINDMFCARAAVPSGASTGKFEAVELRDKEERYLGLGVTKAVHHINTIIRKHLIGQNATRQQDIDRIMIELDGTKNKANLGANAILAVSMAVAKAASEAVGLPLYQYLGGFLSYQLPMPMMNILNGGKHADNTVDFQEFMIMPIKAKNFQEALQIGTEIYHHLKKICKERGLSTGVGDEGGFAPDLKDAYEVLDLLMQAVKGAGFIPGEEVKFAMDVAASELYDAKKQKYFFPGESQMEGKDIYRTSDEMVAYYEKLVNTYPILSIEDGLDEDDFEGWTVLTKVLGSKIQLVGDDLFVTNEERLLKGIKCKAANAILVKVNQIGTLTEAFKTIELAHKKGYKTVVSHRSGETEDAIIADIAVAVNAGQIKTGAPCRSDRVAKYNQLLRIEEELKGINS